MAKNLVNVESVNDRALRLRWRYGGKRYCLALGLSDNVTNRTVAEGKARQIELDILSGHFDLTLDRYRLQPKLEQRVRTTVPELFQKFILEKEKDVYARTMKKYDVALKNLSEYFRAKQAVEITENLAQAFSESLSSAISDSTLKERIGIIRAAWDYGIKLKLVHENPWEVVLRRIKVSPKQPPKPFTKLEMDKIIQGFKADLHYDFYANYVEFLLYSGVRIGEAIALRWSHVSDDCSTVWIGESMSNGVLKTTKTNKSRVLKLSQRLQKLLICRKPEAIAPQRLIFEAKNGGFLDAHNFRNRAWVKVLARADVPYRKPYNTRHTMISHALESGLSPTAVAQLSGHDVETLYQNYAGSVQSHPQLPDF
jgi:integrase